MMATVDRESDIHFHAACYHEAAHAVFAVEVCGGEVLYVKIDDESGECSSSIPMCGGYADHMRDAMRALAGDIAKSLQIAALTGWSDEIEYIEWDLALEIAESGDDVTFGCVGDFCTVVDSVERMADDPFTDGDPEEAYELIFWETVAEVRRLWPEITAVAEALRARKALSGDEVSRLIESARQGVE